MLTIPAKNLSTSQCESMPPPEKFGTGEKFESPSGHPGCCHHAVTRYSFNTPE